MKKSYIFIIFIIIVIITIIVGMLLNWKYKKKELDEFNIEYEEYLNKEVYGTEVATLINKAVDNNNRNSVQQEKVTKDKKDYYFYISNEENSVNIDIKIKDNNTTYKMESIYQGDITKFVQNYNSIFFKCTKIEYNKQGKVKYLLFEQISD